MDNCGGYGVIRRHNICCIYNDNSAGTIKPKKISLKPKCSFLLDLTLLRVVS